MIMSGQPINSSDLSKLLLFILLFLPVVIFGVAALPAIFLIFGIFMMKRGGDFSHVDTSYKNARSYFVFIISIALIVACFFGGQYLFSKSDFEEKYNNPKYSKLSDSSELGVQRLGDRWKIERNLISFSVTIVVIVISIFYLFVLRFLYYKPLLRNKDWVVENGIFSSLTKADINIRSEKKVDIIKGEKLKSYSVADELLKWAKLKDDGHISEQEYNQARDKLLNDS